MDTETLTLNITDLSRTGAGVARYQETVVFVTGALPGETVEARITSREKRYLSAETLQILRASPNRQTPRCSVFGQCGGCDLQHIAYPQQWELKFRGLKHGLTRVGLNTWADRPELWSEFPAQDPWHYRNRVQLRGQGGELGYYARGSRDRVPIADCPIARPEINAALPRIRREGSSRTEVEYKVEVAVQSNGSVQEFWNQAHGASGFRQVNDAQNAVMTDLVHQMLRPHVAGGLLDLYGGHGNLSLRFRESTGANPEIWVVDTGAPQKPEQKFFRMPTARWLQKNANQVRASAAILDPPREGLGEDRALILSALSQMGVSHLVHVGCDPDAWARDLRAYADAGWQPQRLVGLDFFPQTRHVEALALLVKSSVRP